MFRRLLRLLSWMGWLEGGFGAVEGFSKFGG